MNHTTLKHLSTYCLFFFLVLSLTSGHSENSTSLLSTWENTKLDFDQRCTAITTFLNTTTSRDSLAYFTNAFLNEVQQKPDCPEQWQGIALYFQARLQLQQGHTQQAGELLHQTLDFEPFLPDSILALAYTKQAPILRAQNEYVKSAHSFQKAASLFEKINRYGEAASSYNLLGGSVFYELGMYREALTYYRKAAQVLQKLDTLQTNDEKRTLWMIQQNIAVAYMELGNYEMAYAQGVENIKLAKQLADINDLAGTYALLGEAAIKLNDYENGLSKLQQALEIRRAKGVPIWTSETAVLIGSIYLKKGQLDNAETYFSEAHENIRQVKEGEFDKLYLVFHQYDVYQGLGEVRLAKGDFQQAITFCTKALELSNRFNVKSRISKSCNCLAMAYEGLGQVDQSLFYQRRYSTLIEEQIQGNNTKKLKELSLREEFETIRLRDSLAFAAERFEMAMAVEKQRQNRNFTIFIAIGLITIVFLWLYVRRLKIEQTLQREQLEIERLRELDDFKSRLYTNLTHEFRTPLTVILGMVEQLQENPTKYLKQSIHLIESNGKNLLQLINQLLDLSKLENKSLQLQLQQADIVAYLRYLTKSFQTYADNQHLSLHFHTAIDTLVLDHDQEQIKQIITNLLSNAIKFTPPGGTVSVRVTHNQQTLQIEVKDTGIGIAAEDLPHIFDRFYQVNDEMNQGGTGIGLAHTQELITLMKGTITVHSQPGEGTTFRLQLPITNEAPLRSSSPQANISPETQAAPAISTPSTVKKSSHAARILLVEDNPDVVAYLQSCLEDLYHIAIATNGEIGIQSAIQTIPDIIISDVMMPEKNGYELCETLKNDQRTSHIPIILLTAKADTPSKIAGLQRGADAYLAKPFHKIELLVRLEKLLQRQESLKAYFSNLVKRTSELNKPHPKMLAVEALQVENKFMAKIEQIVEANYSDEAFALPQLCQEIGMSRSQLFRKMKALVDMSPSAFIRLRRLQKARQLLESTDLSISEIAWKVGFKDASHFSKSFKTQFGVLPSDLGVL